MNPPLLGNCILSKVHGKFDDTGWTSMGACDIFRKR
jgi:hypothetical protein